MKKRVAIIGILSLVGIAAGAYILTRQPASAPAKSATTEQQITLNPNEHDFFDVDFAQKMIAHHQQGIEMTDALLASSTNQNLRALATEVRTSQLKASEQYKSWLNDWGETYTELADFPQMDGHDMYPSYPGLVSFTELSSLKEAPTNQNDELFISLMTKHHKGGIELEKMSNKLQYGKLIDYKDKVFGEYASEIKRLELFERG